MSPAATSNSETTSKIMQIQEHFRNQILRGQLTAGYRLPPERELASQFGVNLLTINKAMAVLESEMLLERQSSRGTFIHSDVSRGQIMVVFDTCHFMIPELAGFYHRLLESLSSTVKSHGMRPHHMLGHGRRGYEFIDSLEPRSSIWRHAAGVLAMAGLEQFQDKLIHKGIPVVTITSIPGRERHPVLLDMNNMITKAYRHLVKRGARRIALINHNQAVDGLRLLPDSKANHSLEADLLIRLSADGPGFDPSLILTCHPTPRQGYEAMKQLWAVPENRPDGLIISDDNMASGVGQAVVDLGIQTPGQLKIVTHATEGVVRDFPIAFTQSQFDLHRICVGAFGLLYRMMIGQPAVGLIMKAAIKQGATT